MSDSKAGAPMTEAIESAADAAWRAGCDEKEGRQRIGKILHRLALSVAAAARGGGRHARACSGVAGIAALQEESRRRIEELEALLSQARSELHCAAANEGELYEMSEGQFQWGHRCGSCDEYVDRNMELRQRIDAALPKPKP